MLTLAPDVLHYEAPSGRPRPAPPLALGARRGLALLAACALLAGAGFAIRYVARQGAHHRGSAP